MFALWLDSAQQQNLAVLDNFDEEAVEIPNQILTNYSPNARIFPSIAHQTEVSVLDKILSHPSLEERNNHAWYADIKTKEIHEPTDKKRLFTDPEKGDYPVYAGKNIYQFQYDSKVGIDIESPQFWSVEEDNEEYSAKYRVREKSFRKGHLKKSIYSKFGGESTSKSQKSFVNELLEKHRGHPLNKDDILTDFTEYRIGYRAITNSTNERTMIATLIPKGVPCIKTIQTFRPYLLNPTEQNLFEENLHGAYDLIFSKKELTLVTGLLNSLPFDYLMRTKVETDLVKYKLEESQMPRLTEGDDWFEYISSRAAQLNCYGEAFAEMRERLGGIRG